MSYTDTQAALIATLAYADIFDYPLTTAEIGRWFIGNAISEAAVRRSLHDVANLLECSPDGEIHCLRGRTAIISLRNNRTVQSRQKWQRIRHLAAYFRCIPTILLAGVTGGLAMDNAGKEDDIDLIIIVRRGTLYTSRLFATLLADVFGVRRHPEDRDVADMLCLNMFIDEDALALPEQESDLYTAHEILQMQPVWQRRQAHRRFIQANGWIRSILPNAWSERLGENPLPLDTESPAGLPVRLETFFRDLQLRHMKHRRTTEVVTDHMLKFHPADTRMSVRQEFGKRLKRYGIPLDKFFFRRIK